MDTQVLNTKKTDVDVMLSASGVIDLYSKCILNNSDFDDEGLTCSFSIGEGVSSKCVFSCERLNENREELSSYIEQLSDIDQAPSLMRLYYDQNGKKWTDDSMVIEMLVQMGTASHMISLLYPPEIWYLLPGGVPYVGKTIYTSKEKVIGINGSEYVKLYGTNR